MCLLQVVTVPREHGHQRSSTCPSCRRQAKRGAAASHEAWAGVPWAGSSCCPREQRPVAGVRDGCPRSRSAPLLCRCLPRPLGDLHSSSGECLASSLMGEVCKIHSQIVSALFFKQGAAFSACYAAREEPGGCGAATSPLSSRDTQGMALPVPAGTEKGKLLFL